MFFLSIKTHAEPVLQDTKSKKKIALRVSKADHGDVPIIIGFQKYLDVIGEFIIE
jgi:hypothetical protein